MKMTIGQLAADKLMSLKLVGDNQRRGQRSFQPENTQTEEEDELGLSAADGDNNPFNWAVPANYWTRFMNGS